jgi:pimeloyl-ACP methyl ester carboxylesterase
VAVFPEPRLEGTYRLDRGRVISFAEYGLPAGRPIFWFHGTPGGRRQIAPTGRVAAAHMGVRLIALDRPGIGLSTPHLHANIAASADDVLTLADRLGIGEFACAGLSGGGPYVLACAARAPDRVVAGAILGGVAPSRGPEAIAGGLVGVVARVAPVAALSRHAIGHALHFVVRAAAPAGPLVFDGYIALQPEGDRAVFGRPEMKAMFLDDFLRGSRRQFHAPVLDALLFSREWGFSVADITVPIRFWHGDADPIVPLAHAEHLAALVADSELRVRPGESHLGALGAAEEVFGLLLELWPPADQTDQASTA